MAAEFNTNAPEMELSELLQIRLIGQTGRFLDHSILCFELGTEPFDLALALRSAAFSGIQLILHRRKLLCSLLGAAGSSHCLCSSCCQILAKGLIVLIQCGQAALKLRNLILEIGFLLLCKLKLSLCRSKVCLCIGRFLLCSGQISRRSAFAAALDDRTVLQFLLCSTQLILRRTELTAEAGQLRLILSNLRIVQAAAGFCFLFQLVAFFLKCIDL